MTWRISNAKNLLLNSLRSFVSFLVPYAHVEDTIPPNQNPYRALKFIPFWSLCAQSGKLMALLWPGTHKQSQTSPIKVNMKISTW